jgi:hypothetical protein
MFPVFDIVVATPPFLAVPHLPSVGFPRQARGAARAVPNVHPIEISSVCVCSTANCARRTLQAIKSTIDGMLPGMLCRRVDFSSSGSAQALDESRFQNVKGTIDGPDHRVAPWKRRQTPANVHKLHFEASGVTDLTVWSAFVFANRLPAFVGVCRHWVGCNCGSRTQI